MRAARHRAFMAALIGLVSAWTLIGLARGEPETPRAMTAAELEDHFQQARVAYDENRLSDAIQIYEVILTGGYFSEALFFNLGNAHFRRGELGQAVLYYKRAQYLSPRDPDVLANLQFAFDTAGVAVPPAPLVERWARKISYPGWLTGALAGYWGAAFTGCAYIAWRRHRPVLSRIAVVLVALLIVSLTGMMTWSGLHRTPEVVITHGSQQVLFAPLEGSTVHFAAPEGTVLRVRESSDTWIRVVSGKKSGWIQRSACERVYPWRTAANLPASL